VGCSANGRRRRRRREEEEEEEEMFSYDVSTLLLQEC